MDGINALNREWTAHNFVLCVTWVDVDNDKQPNYSPLWVLYGCRVTPTKDKKLKPVNHLMVSVATGYLIWICPDTLETTQADMIRTAIREVFRTNSPAQRASHCLLLDRGYLKYAKAQNLDVTNLIQILRDANFKYHGTV